MENGGQVKGIKDNLKEEEIEYQISVFNSPMLVSHHTC